jgi:hypothetical protein
MYCKLNRLTTVFCKYNKFLSVNLIIIKNSFKMFRMRMLNIMNFMLDEIQKKTIPAKS